MTILTVLPDSPATDRRPASTVTGPETVAHPHAEQSGHSPLMVGLSVMAIAVVAVWALTATAMLVLTDISFWAAFGLGAYCAFWLGGGFGTIFGSAVVFGREH